MLSLNDASGYFRRLGQNRVVADIFISVALLLLMLVTVVLAALVAFTWDDVSIPPPLIFR